MKRLLLLTAAGVVVVLILCWIFDTSIAATGSNVSETVNADFERVENLIIIEGIRHDAEPVTASGDHEPQGKIIIDNSFISDPEKSVSPSHKGQEGVVRKSEPGIQHSADALKSLKRKDSRGHITEYTIRRGDNLWEIAQRFDTDHRLIITVNNITRPDMLRPGNRIKVPNKKGTYHNIKKGDTLSEIAHTYRVELNIIKDHNNINDSRLIAGNRIFIPDGRIATSSVPSRMEHHEPVRQRNSKNNTVVHKKVQVAAARKARTGTGRNAAVSARRSFSWPLRGRITSAFGSRTNPLTRRKSFHSGIDIGVPEGTAVSASADGKVIFSGWKDTYGNMIIVKHSDGYITVYAHNKKNLVSENDTVTRGDKIALSGMTGFVTGPHLHYEIRKHLTPLNPRRFLR